MTLTLDDPRWPLFEERLAGPEGCNFRTEDGSVRWDCKGGSDKTHAEKILHDMGLGEDEIKASFAYFEARGGFCDCEIVLNVFPTTADEIVIRKAQEGDHAD